MIHSLLTELLVDIYSGLDLLCVELCSSITTILFNMEGLLFTQFSLPPCQDVFFGIVSDHHRHDSALSDHSENNSLDRV